LLSGQVVGYHLLTHEALEIELMKHLVALALIALLLPAVAVLLPATVSTVAVAKDNPCKQDKKKFCEDVKSKGAKMRECMKQHKDELSAECKAARDKKKADNKGKKKTDNNGKKKTDKPAAPAASQSETPSKQEMMPGGSDGASE
jgi:peptidoglycan hydrolase CwlO-like protein